MMFRKLYWVTEQVDPLGTSCIAGVYTSIPDLLKNGLYDLPLGCRLRLTLTKLDTDQPPFGTWTEPEFTSLPALLSRLVVTEEFSPEHCHMLLDALDKRVRISA